MFGREVWLHGSRHVSFIRDRVRTMSVSRPYLPRSLALAVFEIVDCGTVCDVSSCDLASIIP